MHHIIIQRIADKTLVPKSSLLRQWAKAALHKKIESAEITIRIVGIKEMTDLNSTYRHKKGPTNVLSFPFTMPKGIPIDVPILGDIVICAEVVNSEALEQAKQREAHWAHMVVHGTLHLLGYDHETDTDADLMEKLEIEIMNSLNFTDPYQHGDDRTQHE